MLTTMGPVGVPGVTGPIGMTPASAAEPRNQLGWVTDAAAYSAACPGCAALAPVEAATLVQTNVGYHTRGQSGG